MNNVFQISFANDKSDLGQVIPLLNTCLREPGLDFSIKDEYPILLGDSFQSTSLCAYHGPTKKIVAHLSYTTKTLELQKGDTHLKIGLIGNVATHPDWQKQGIMSEMFQHIEHHANANNVNAIILWSDLSKFYQKLGYLSLNQELHFYINKEKIKKFRHGAPSLAQFISLKTVDKVPLQNLGNLRKTAGLDIPRSPDEFRQLLSIPHTFLYVDDIEKPEAYAVFGKGFDMVGVVHEWGCIEQESLFAILEKILDEFDLDELILLSPTFINKNLKNTLINLSSHVNQQPMALAKPLQLTEHKYSILNEKLFIWGLDSI